MTDNNSLVPLAAASSLPLEVQAELEELLATGTELTANRHAELTRKAYESDFAHFADWCDATAERTGAAVPPLPQAGDSVVGRSRIGPTVRHDVPGVVAMAGLGRIIVTLSTSRPACVSWRGSG